MGECTAEDRDVEGSIPSCGTFSIFCETVVSVTENTDVLYKL